MKQNLAVIDNEAQAKTLEQVIVKGDISGLTSQQKTDYYHAVCRSTGLNPLTSPFGYMKLSGREVLYAKKDATDQLRKINGISLEIVSQESDGDLYIVTARATDKTGRTDEDTGAVSVKNLQGESLANAIMKAITKAKRRVTLSICSLAWLEETETDVDMIPAQAPVSLVAAPILDEIRALMRKLGIKTVAEAKALTAQLLEIEPVSPEDLTENEAVTLLARLAERYPGND